MLGRLLLRSFGLVSRRTLIGFRSYSTQIDKKLGSLFKVIYYS